jgi:RNAse (barnase) inhibitor barstar
MHTKQIYEIDGATFSTQEEFASHFSDVVLVNYKWFGNLDAFKDILRGGFGTPDVGFLIRWLNSDISREKLGYKETIKYLEAKLANCHPSNRERVSL